MNARFRGVARFLGESNVFHGPVQVDGARRFLTSPEASIDETQSVVSGGVGHTAGDEVALVVRPTSIKVFPAGESRGDVRQVCTRTSNCPIADQLHRSNRDRTRDPRSG
jgi:ABC-type Fe3+/spermidine/putrescine transport system ATPase subunit